MYAGSKEATAGEEKNIGVRIEVSFQDIYSSCTGGDRRKNRMKNENKANSEIVKARRLTKYKFVSRPWLYFELFGSRMRCEVHAA